MRSIPRTATTYEDHGGYAALVTAVDSQRVPWPTALASLRVQFRSAVLGDCWPEAGAILAQVFATSPESAARLWIDLLINFRTRARAQWALGPPLSPRRAVQASANASAHAASSTNNEDHADATAFGSAKKHSLSQESKTQSQQRPKRATQDRAHQQNAPQQQQQQEQYTAQDVHHGHGARQAALQQQATREATVNGTAQLQLAQVAELHAMQQRHAAERLQGNPRTPHVMAQRPACGTAQQKQQRTEKMKSQMYQASNQNLSGTGNPQPQKTNFTKGYQNEDLVEISDDDEGGQRSNPGPRRLTMPERVNPPARSKGLAPENPPGRSYGCLWCGSAFKLKSVFLGHVGYLHQMRQFILIKPSDDHQWLGHENWDDEDVTVTRPIVLQNAANVQHPWSATLQPSTVPQQPNMGFQQWQASKGHRPVPCLNFR